MVFDISTEDAFARTSEVFHKWDQDDPLIIKGFHVTTSANGCSDLLANGIDPIGSVLSNPDSELSKFLQSYGVAIDISEWKATKQGSILSLNAFPFKRISKLLTRKVSAFLWCSNVEKYGEIHCFPEFLNEMVKEHVLPPTALEEWATKRHAYKIYFAVDVKQIANDCLHPRTATIKEKLLKHIEDRQRKNTTNCEMLFDAVPAACIERIIPL